MRRIVRCVLAVLMLAAVAGPADAGIDPRRVTNQPGATLLVPYFEVGLKDGPNTLIRYGITGATDPDAAGSNNGPSAGVARTTLWSNLGIPVFAYDTYLTGFDMQTVNLRSLLSGQLPLTADDGADPGDTSAQPDGISNQGNFSQDINFVGPADSVCGTTPPTRIPPDQLAHIRAALTGARSPLTGNCYCIGPGGNIARGYITIDTMTRCMTTLPTDPDYFNNVDHRNLLWGDYKISGGAKYSGTMVHMRSRTDDPLTSGLGKYTFYGRLSGFNTTDHRQPLATKFAADIRNTGGKVPTKTTLFVWRDPKDVPNASGFPCGFPPAWVPLDQDDVVMFDEQEVAFNVVSNAFPLATQRVLVDGPTLPIPFTSGWMYLDLNHQKIAGPTTDPAAAQAWVTVGQTGASYPAITLDSAADGAFGTKHQPVFPDP